MANGPASQLFGLAQQSIGAQSKDVETAVQLGQQMQNVQLKRQQIEQSKQQLEFAKFGKIADSVHKGLTKVPKKARQAYFNNFVRPQAERFGVDINQSFFDAITSDDVDTAAMSEGLINIVNGARTLVETGQAPESLAPSLSLLQETMSGGVDKVGDLFFKGVGQASQAKAQERAAMLSTAKFETTEARQVRENFESRKANVNKELNKNDIPGLESSLKPLKELIPGGLDNWNGENIPGVGKGEGLLPITKLGPKGRRIRQLADGVRNQLLKARSGGAVSEGEAARLLGEIGYDTSLNEAGSIVKAVFVGARDDSDFVNGLRDIERRLETVKGNLRRTYGDDAYFSVIGQPSGEQAQQEQQTTQPAPKDELTPNKIEAAKGLVKQAIKAGGTKDSIRKILINKFPRATAAQIEDLVSTGDGE